jgi:hypothetical protein
MILKIHIDTKGGVFNRRRLVTLCEILTAWAEHAGTRELWDFAQGKVIVVSDGDGDPDKITFKAVKLDN